MAHGFVRKITLARVRNLQYRPANGRMWMTKLWSCTALLLCLGMAVNEPVWSQQVRAVT